MGIPLMIQEDDNRRIEHLKKDFHIHKKIDVIRAGLALLEKEAALVKRDKRHTINNTFLKEISSKKSLTIW